MMVAIFGKDAIAGRVRVILPGYQPSGGARMIKPPHPVTGKQNEVQWQAKHDWGSNDDLIAANYIFRVMEGFADTTPEITFDTTGGKIAYCNDDISIFAIGLWSNWYLDKFKDETGHRYFKLSDDSQKIAILKTNKEFKNEGSASYGLLLKIRPKNHPQRVWFLCAGLDGMGTRGTTWFAANKVNDIRKHTAKDGKPIGDREFLFVIQTNPGRDQSGQIVYGDAIRNETNETGNEPK